MKKKILLLPMFLLLLAACGNPTSSASDSTPGTSTPGTSDTSSEPDLPSTPSSETPVVASKTIAEIRAIPLDNAGNVTDSQKVRVRTTGVVTKIYRGAVDADKKPAWNVIIQDGVHGLMLYNIAEADIASFGSVGKEITVEGRIAPYKFLWELDQVKVIEAKDGTAVAPTALTSIKQDDLKNKDSVLVKISGLKRQNLGTVVATTDDTGKSNISASFNVGLGEDVISTYMHYNIPLAEAQAVVEKLSTYDSADELEFVGVIGMNAGTFQLTIAHASELTITDKGAPVLTGLTFENASETLSVGETLKVAPKVAPYDASIEGLTFTSSVEAVATVAADGTVTAVAAGTSEISAKVGAIEGKITINVSSAPVSSYKVTADPEALTGDDKNKEISDPAEVSKFVGLPSGTSISDYSKFYIVTGGGASSSNNFPAGAVLFKLGTSSASAAITFTLPEGTLVNKVTVSARAWGNDVTTLTINDIVSEELVKYDASDATKVKDYAFNLATATNVITLKTTKRALITQIEFHFELPK